MIGITSLDSIKDKHLGKEFVIVGGGPSTSNYPDLFSKEKIVIGCNFRPNHINLNYHVLHDPLSLMWNKKNNVDFLKSSVIFSQFITCVSDHNKNQKVVSGPYYSPNPNNMRDFWVGDVPVKEYLDSVLLIKDRKEIFGATSCSPNCLEQYGPKIGDRWINTGFWCIDLAKYLGASKIYLTGFDGNSNHSYDHPQSDRLERMKNRSYDSHYIHFVRRMDEIKKDIQIELINCEESMYNLPKINV